MTTLVVAVTFCSSSSLTAVVVFSPIRALALLAALRVAVAAEYAIKT